MTNLPFRIVEIIYPAMTQLDFTGPHTVFSRLPQTEVIVASLTGGTVVSDGALHFANTAKLDDVERCDLLFLPGGVSAAEEVNNEALLGHIRRLATGARYITSVCNGSLILAAAGLLNGKRAACHWAWRHMLSLFGAIPDAGRVVRDGNTITGGGVTAGIDFAFVVAAELAGEQMAQALQLGLEYAPTPPFNSGTPDTAPPEVLELVRSRTAASLPRAQAAMERAAARLKQPA